MGQLEGRQKQKGQIRAGRSAYQQVGCALSSDSRGDRSILTTQFDGAWILALSKLCALTLINEMAVGERQQRHELALA